MAIANIPSASKSAYIRASHWTQEKGPVRWCRGVLYAPGLDQTVRAHVAWLAINMGSKFPHYFQSVTSSVLSFPNMTAPPSLDARTSKPLSSPCNTRCSQKRLRPRPEDEVFRPMLVLKLHPKSRWIREGFQQGYDDGEHITASGFHQPRIIKLHGPSVDSVMG